MKGIEDGNMEDSKLKEIHDYLIDLAHEAGERITSAKPSTSTVDLKKNCTLKISRENEFCS
jgi:hypothetical protein